jgi:PmbA protein
MRAENSWEFLADTVRKTLKRLEELGAELAEAFFSATWTTEVTIRNSEVLAENVMEDAGVGFRVAVSGNRVGFACTNVVNTEKAVFEAGERALSIAKSSAPVPDFALPSSLKVPMVQGLFDSAVLDASVEESVNIARRMIQSTENVDKRITAKGGQVSISYIQRGVVNSLGVDVEAKETQVGAGVYGTGRRNGEVTPSCFDIELKRCLDLHPEKIGDAVGQMIIAQFNPKPVESFEGTVIFEPEAVSYQLCDAMIGALKGENVGAGSSPWIGKLGETVASENLTVVDNGVLDGGFASRSFDDEGYPSQATTLVSKGTLKSFLHNATTSNKLGMQNTGNASRSGGGFEMTKQIIGNGYKAKPEVYPSNLVIEAGRKTKHQLTSDVKRGVLAETMGGFVQAGSGLISAQLVRAQYIEKGEMKHPIKGGMVSGIAFDWLKQIDEIGNDGKQFFNSVVPSVRIEKVKIIGSR